MTDGSDAAEPGHDRTGMEYPGGTWRPPTDSTDVPLLADQRPPRVALGVLAGVITAVVAGFIWYQVVALSSMQIGILAIGVGLLIGAAMRFAAGGAGTRSLQVSAVLITLVTMLLAEYFVARKFVGDFYASQGDDAPLQLFIAPVDMISVAVDSVRADPVTLLFWFIALTAAVRMTKPAEHGDGGAVIDPATV